MNSKKNAKSPQDMAHFQTAEPLAPRWIESLFVLGLVLIVALTCWLLYRPMIIYMIRELFGSGVGA